MVHRWCTDDIVQIQPDYNEKAHKGNIHFCSAGINGFGISERFLHIDIRSFGYTPDAEFGSYAFWYY
jgi:hypothetical protein